MIKPLKYLLYLAAPVILAGVACSCRSEEDNSDRATLSGQVSVLAEKMQGMEDTLSSSIEKLEKKAAECNSLQGPPANPKSEDAQDTVMRKLSHIETSVADLSSHLCAAEISTVKTVEVQNPNAFPLENIIKDDPSYHTIKLSAKDGKDERSVEISVPTTEYLKLLKMGHRTKKDSSEYVGFVTYNVSLIRTLAEGLTIGSKSQEETAERILQAVQTLKYDNTKESRGFDYIKFPLQTLIEGNGDCEDLAILAAALMKSLGLDVALIKIDSEKEDIHHISLGVVGNFDGSYYEFKGKKYFSAEARPNWKIGQIPDEHKKIDAYVYIVD